MLQQACKHLYTYVLQSQHRTNKVQALEMLAFGETFLNALLPSDMFSQAISKRLMALIFMRLCILCPHSLHVGEQLLESLNGREGLADTELT